MIAFLWNCISISDLTIIFMALDNLELLLES